MTDEAMAIQGRLYSEEWSPKWFGFPRSHTNTFPVKRKESDVGKFRDACVTARHKLFGQ